MVASVLKPGACRKPQNSTSTLFQLQNIMLQPQNIKILTNHNIFLDHQTQNNKHSNNKFACFTCEAVTLETFSNHQQLEFFRSLKKLLHTPAT